VNDLRERLIVLAERGNPRGAENVLDAAARAAERAVAEAPADDAYEPLPFAAPEPPIRVRARRPFGSMVAAAGIAALLVVGTLAVGGLVGRGGASSPEAAVRRLADAIAHEDPLAAVDVLAPSEVRTLHEVVDAAARKAAETELVESAGAPLAGIDIAVEGLVLRAEPLADGYARVYVDGGHLSAGTDTAALAPVLQRVLRDGEGANGDVDLARFVRDDERELPTFVIAVRDGGQWYVSAAYTILEYVREFAEVAEVPEFGAGTRAAATLGAETPDAAVKDFVTALAHDDWDRAFALFPPDELPLYEYRNVLKAAFDLNDDGEASFEIDRLDTTSKTDGDAAAVVLHAAGRAGEGRWSIDGGCFRGPEDEEVLPFGVSSLCFSRDLPPQSMVSFVSFFGSPRNDDTGRTDAQPITAVRRDGRWFVSPVGTALDLLDGWIERYDRRALYGFLGIADQLPPDGALEVGEPVTIAKGSAPKVFTLDLGGSQTGLTIVVRRADDQTELDGGVWAEVYRRDRDTIEWIGPGYQVYLDGPGAYTLVVQSLVPYDVTVALVSETVTASPATTVPAAGG
jgi:hypothetical protein